MMSSLVEYLPTDQKAQVLSFIDASKQLDLLRGEKPKAGWWWHPSAWVYRWHRQRFLNLLLQYLKQP
jgi:hypothetical protein